MWLKNLCAVCTHKAVTILACVIGFYCFQFNRDQFEVYFAHWPAYATEPSVSNRLSAWNGAQYLILSERGYERSTPASAFYPFWPALISAGSFVTGLSPLIVALLLANIFSVVGVLLLGRIFDQQIGRAASGMAIALLLATPGAFFFCFPYTESLYVFLVALFFLALKHDHFTCAGFVAFFLPLTKAIGVFCVLPFAWYLFEKRVKLKTWLLLAMPFLGYLTYFGTMYAFTGDAFDGFKAQKMYPNSPSISNGFDLQGLFQATLQIKTIDGMMDAIVDRGLFFLVLVSLPALFRHDKTWFWYTVSAGVIPALTNWYMSYRRFVIVLFPVFAIWALWIHRTGNRWLFYYYVFVCALMQFWAVMRFINFDWAG